MKKEPAESSRSPGRSMTAREKVAVDPTVSFLSLSLVP
jgi:hypothetical protein